MSSYLRLSSYFSLTRSSSTFKKKNLQKISSFLTSNFGFKPANLISINSMEFRIPQNCPIKDFKCRFWVNSSTYGILLFTKCLWKMFLYHTEKPILRWNFLPSSIVLWLSRGLSGTNFKIRSERSRWIHSCNISTKLMFSVTKYL